jgi:4-hydroxybenzoate polyprenyltransferase
MLSKSFLSLFLALSRNKHAVLDIATPAFCALLWLGKFPPISVTILSLITAFAGYTAIYALNDIVGCKIDKVKMTYACGGQQYSVEAGDLRHPIAQELISYKMAILWMSFWLLIAVVGAYLLNPYILIILGLAAVCEIAYCRLLRVTHWRIILSGFVKVAGPASAVLVVDPAPDFAFLMLLLLWIFLWEIGGQNIPADWNDREEDERIGAKTIPVKFGESISKRIVMCTTLLTVISSGFLVSISPLPLGSTYVAWILMIGTMILIIPAYALYNATEITTEPARLFDFASYYPLALLVLTAGSIVINSVGW